MDILAALADDTAERGPSRCALGQWLDAIPADTEGREHLIALIETPHERGARSGTMSAARVVAVLRKLGWPYASENPILDHRQRRCRCWI